MELVLCSYGIYVRKCQAIQQTHTANLAFATVLHGLYDNSACVSV